MKLRELIEALQYPDSTWHFGNRPLRELLDIEINMSDGKKDFDILSIYHSDNEMPNRKERIWIDIQPKPAKKKVNL